MRLSSSESTMSLRISINFFLSMVSKALLMSIPRIVQVYWNFCILAIRNLCARTISVVNLFGLNPACDADKQLSIFCLIIVRVIVHHFFSREKQKSRTIGPETDSRTIGLWFETGPGGLPGFGRWNKLSAFMSKSSLFSKQLLKILTICGAVIQEEAFKYSAGMFSCPDALLSLACLYLGWLLQEILVQLKLTSMI